VLPDRLSGMIWYLRTVSVGTSLMIVRSILNWERLIAGTPYCLLRRAVICSSLTNPILMRL
jgi:hypothetical protein